MSAGMDPSDCVVAHDEGAVRVVTLNRPELRNAIDLDLRVVLAELLEKAMADDDVRVIVLTGAGTSFCSGGDISTMRRMGPAESRPRAEAAKRVITAIWDGPKPVVAAVEGYAMGAGTALALACDRVVAARDATFSTTFTGVGLAGDMGVFASLPARVGIAAARQLMLLPKRLTGEEAQRLGMVDAVTAPGEALAQSLVDAATIAAGPPLALREIKRMFTHWPADPREVLGREVELQTRLFDSEDFAEGVAAFRERRNPVFRGR